MTLGQIVTFRGKIDIGKVNSHLYDHFDVDGLIAAPLGEPQSAVQYLTPWPLMTTGGQTIGCAVEHFDMCNIQLMVHIVCHF